MTSQITKDFKMKSRLRALADGGSANPNMLGSGAAARAGGFLAGRGRQIDAAVDAAGAPAPTPAPAPAPAPAPQQVAQAPKKSGLRSMLGLADGGSYLDDGYNANRYQQSQLKDGGRVKGPGGRTDDKVGPVMLSDEEYVLPGDTADAIGRDKLDAIRLATHEFKDERKESALRGRADGGDGWYDDMMPMDHLADGGNPWIVDSKGTVRTNSFGDAAAGPGYQQPRLPPPQPGTAVQVAQPPMGQRPPIDITPPGSRTPPAAQVVDAVTDVTPKTAMSRAGSALRGAARVGAPVAGIAGAAQSFDDQSTGYRDHFQNSVGAETPLGSVAADAARVLANVGDAALFGLPGRLGRGIAGAIGGDGFVNGFMSPSDRDQYLQNRTQQTMATAGGASAAPAAAAGPTSALRSDQGPAQPVTPGSYQSRRLSEMGVPLDVQNSKPVVDSVTGSTRDFLRTGGTDKYQNLGTYGGDANIYGKADDPSRPGRINNFVGVGAGASPANEANGSGFNSAITSALRGLGNGPSSPGGSGGNSGAVDNSAEINARYDKLAKQLSGMYGPKGQGNLARRLLELEQSRSGALDADARNATSRSNAAMQSSTLRDNAQLSARTSMLDTLGRMEQNRATISAQAQAAQRKAVEDARKIGEERDAESVKAYESVADSFAGGDKKKSQYYREVLSTLGPELDQLAQGLTPTDKRAFYTNILRQQVGRDEGLVLGRDVGATVQNAAIGGLIGRMSRLGDGAAGKAVDTALGKIPRIGPVISALRPAENLARFGTILGAGAGALATPEIEDYNRFDPVARDPVSGAALPAREDLREAFTHGAFDTYFNPFNDDVQTVSGRRTNRPNPTEEEAARRFRATLRTE